MKSLPFILTRSLYTLLLAIGLFLTFSTLAFAQGEAYQPLTGIPGVDPNNLSLVSYVNALFLLSIALGAMLAVIKIVLAGFKYMFTDVVTTKSDAKSDIYGALLGLGILLATFVVLYTINPQLTSLNILTGAQRVELVENAQPVPQVTPAGRPTECRWAASGEQRAAYEACLQQCESAGGELSPLLFGVRECSYSDDAGRYLRISCDEADCSDAIEQCNEVGYTRADHDRSDEGYLLCFYGVVEILTLDASFDGQPGNIRQSECFRIGGTSYDYSTDTCRKVTKGN